MINTLSTQYKTLLLCLTFTVILGSQSASAQEMSREVREKFQSMLGDLDVSLRKKFQKAIDNNSPIVEMTPEEFRKFQLSPANPFEINDVDPDELDGNIELRFELPSLRNRPVEPSERQSRSLRRNLKTVVGSAAESTVRITDGRDQLALGTVVRADGVILTKASEVDSVDELYVQVGVSRNNFRATLLASDSKNDLALLKINAQNLAVVSWSNKQPRNGTFVLSPDPTGQVMSVGTYSVVPRSTIGENQGFLGVAPRTVNAGVEIVDPIDSDTAAFAAGLQKGDVITKIDDHIVLEVQQLVDEIRKRTAGDKVLISFLRDGNARTTTAKLAGRSLSGERAARFKMMSRLGAVPSERDSGFPVVFQHDSPLFPETCGGPIVDLAGNIIGVNIARESRAASYAIPAAHVRTLVEQMLSPEVATLNSQSR